MPVMQFVENKQKTDPGANAKLEHLTSCELGI